MKAKIEEKLKAEAKEKVKLGEHHIYSYLNQDYIVGDNEKYMTMYNKMAPWYDFGEKWIGKLKYGKSLTDMRKQLMEQLEWKDNLSVLYVSIGTGSDLTYLPQTVDLASLDFVGLDISLGMLEKCRKSWAKKTNLSLVHACAEDLPFADNTFDIVLHVGGINFFSDKERAMREMLRVAKPGTKLLIADETADYVDKQYKKSSFSKKYFEGTDFDLSEIESIIPQEVKEKKLELIWQQRFYILTFRK